MSSYVDAKNCPKVLEMEIANGKGDLKLNQLFMI